MLLLQVKLFHSLLNTFHLMALLDAYAWILYRFEDVRCVCGGWGEEEGGGGVR